MVVHLCFSLVIGWVCPTSHLKSAGIGLSFHHGIYMISGIHKGWMEKRKETHILTQKLQLMSWVRDSNYNV